ncbi:MAG: hypothetical protein KJ852_16740 [Gammaproteobacteria bacterium]|nr:hypothetical protein [Gammaproteobacteria bacterium]MBU0786870.1 hypothetical protein [Gammaproteobacteria bacterium]MBU0813924.1 hypothetical protein [Gammaproteobacteria bacterium]MBU1788603.1 hypothetical protein [Gammaproteobacteria bacterium]
MSKTFFLTGSARGLGRSVPAPSTRLKVVCRPGRKRPPLVVVGGANLLYTTDRINKECHISQWELQHFEKCQND